MSGPATATVEAWVAAVPDYLMAVARAATQDLVEEIKRPLAAGGHMPIDTSFLQSSLVGSLTGVPRVDPDATGESGPMTGSAAAIEALIGNWSAGTTLHFGFVAAYAARQNYGFSGADALGRVYNQPGHHFLELAVQQWPSLVAKHQRRLAAQVTF